MIVKSTEVLTVYCANALFSYVKFSFLKEVALYKLYLRITTEILVQKIPKFLIPFCSDI